MLTYSYLCNKLWINVYSFYNNEIDEYIEDIWKKMEEYKIKERKFASYGEDYYNNDSITELTYLIWKIWKETWRFDKFKSSWLRKFIIDNFTRKSVYTWKRVFMKDGVDNLLNYFLIYLLLPQFFLNFYIRYFNKIDLNQIDADLIHNCVVYLIEYWNIMAYMPEEKYLPEEDLLLEKLWWYQTIIEKDDLWFILAHSHEGISKDVKISEAWFWTVKLRTPFTSTGEKMVWIYKEFLKSLRDYFINNDVELKLFNLKNADFNSIMKIANNLISILNVDNDIWFPRYWIPESWEWYIKVVTPKADEYKISIISSIWFFFGYWLTNHLVVDTFFVDTFSWLRYRTYRELQWVFWGKLLKLPWLIKITEENIDIIKKFINDKKGVRDFLYLFSSSKDTYNAIVCVRYM